MLNDKASYDYSATYGQIIVVCNRRNECLFI